MGNVLSDEKPKGWLGEVFEEMDRPSTPDDFYVKYRFFLYPFFIILPTLQVVVGGVWLGDLMYDRKQGQEFKKYGRRDPLKKSDREMARQLFYRSGYYFAFFSLLGLILVDYNLTTRRYYEAIERKEREAERKMLEEQREAQQRYVMEQHQQAIGEGWGGLE